MVWPGLWLDAPGICSIKLPLFLPMLILAKVHLLLPRWSLSKVLHPVSFQLTETEAKVLSKAPTTVPALCKGTPV
jgi:hypothetical protein